MLTAIRGANVMTLLTGVLVLAGALAAGLSERLYDAVVLKTYGASRRQLIGAFVIEYAALGLAAALFGLLVGSLGSWFLARFILEMPWSFSFATAALTALIAMAGDGGSRARGHLAGTLGQARALPQKRVDCLLPPKVGQGGSTGKAAQHGRSQPHLHPHRRCRRDRAGHRRARLQGAPPHRTPMARWTRPMRCSASCACTPRRADMAKLDAMLARIQNELFDLGADLCVPDTGKDLGYEPLRILPKQYERIETEIDDLNGELAAAALLRAARRPSGGRASASRAHRLPPRRTPDRRTRRARRASM